MKGHCQTTVEMRELAKKFQKQRRHEYPRTPGSLPRSVPKDKRRVIVQNHVQHTVDTANGTALSYETLGTADSRRFRRLLVNYSTSY